MDCMLLIFLQTLKKITSIIYTDLFPVLRVSFLRDKTLLLNCSAYTWIFHCFVKKGQVSIRKKTVEQNRKNDENYFGANSVRSFHSMLWLLTWGCTGSCHHSISGGAGWGWWSSELLPSWSSEILCLESRSTQPCCCSESVFSWCCWSEDDCLSTSGQKIYQFDIPAMKAWYANWNHFHTSHYCLT